MKTRQSITMFIAAICLGIIVAAAVASRQSVNAPVTALGTYGSSQASQTGAADTGTAATTETATAVAADPAKASPILSLFTHKNPFSLLMAPPVTAPTDGGTGGTAQPTSATISVDGSSSTVKVGDQVPQSNSVFRVSALTSSGVTFELLDGKQFVDGTSSVTVAEGGTADVTLPDGKKSTIVVNTLNFGSGGGSSSTQGSHTISVTHIDSQNGTAVATIVVDGKTYADKQVGDTFSTGWGDVRVVDVDATAQTVTIVHGDVTLTLSVGQSVTK